MRTDTIKSITISQSAFDWLKDCYTAVDRMDAAAYRTFLAADCQLAFGNQPVTSCNNEIIGGIRHFWEAIGGLDHAFVHVVGHDFHFAAEALIDYIRKDGRVVSIPCITVIERNAEGLARYIRIFIDTAPIFS